jgi:hypothetical protein
VGYGALWGEETNEYTFLIRRPEGRMPLGDLGVIGRIILRTFLNE